MKGKGYLKINFESKRKSHLIHLVNMRNERKRISKMFALFKIQFKSKICTQFKY